MRMLISKNTTWTLVLILDTHWESADEKLGTNAVDVAAFMTLSPKSSQNVYVIISASIIQRVVCQISSAIGYRLVIVKFAVDVVSITMFASIKKIISVETINAIVVVVVVQRVVGRKIHRLVKSSMLLKNRPHQTQSHNGVKF